MRPAQLDAVVLGDAPAGWSQLGFSMEDHAMGSVLRLGNTDVILTDDAGGFEGWAVRGIDGPVAGLPTIPVESDPPPAAAGDPGTPSRHAERAFRADRHPNGIRGIDHIVFHSGDPDNTCAALEAAGIEKRGDRSTQSYGAPMRQMFFWLGDVILELIGPGEGEETTAGPPSFFGLALWTDDLDASVAALGPLAGVPKDAVQPGRRIAGIRGSEVGVTTPLALMSPHV